MQFTLEKLDKNFATVEVQVSPEEIEEALSESYKKVVTKVSVPGFRKGHTPRFILEKQFGKEVLYEDALDVIVPKGYTAALDQFELAPIDQPKLEVVEPLDAGKTFVFKATVELMPEVQLGEYKGLTVEKTQVEVSEEQVAERLKALQERHAELILSEKQDLAKGDFAVIDFEGYLDGNPFPGGAAQAYTLEIGSGSFIPGFEEQLIGAKIGEEREIGVTFPEDYHKKELAGQPVTFKVTLKEIKVKEIPVLDDEFAQSVGQFENLSQLKEDTEQKIREAGEREAERNYAQAAVDQAVGGAVVGIPDVLVKREMEELLHRFEHNLSYQGLTMEQFLGYANKTQEEVLEDFRPDAVKRVKTDLVLGSIAKQEQIAVDEAELDVKLEEMAQQYQRKNAAELKKDLAKRGRLEDIRQAIVLEKTAAFIKEQAVPHLVSAAPGAPADETEKTAAE